MVKKKTTNKKATVQKVIKTVSFTREQILTFLEFEEKEAGEFIIAIARYVSDGKYPTFKDRFKNLFFKNTFGNSLERQLRNYDTKTAICQNNAEKRKGTTEDTAADVAESNEDGAIEKGDNDNANVATTNVPPSNDGTTEDLSYSAFLTLYGKRDAREMGGEYIWNKATDDEKGKIIAYVKERIIDKFDVTKRDYPSQFLKSNAWK